MTCKKLGRQSFALPSAPAIIASACVAGEKEGKGPLAQTFDRVLTDDLMGRASWEQAESAMQLQALSLAQEKAGLTGREVDVLLAGDLLNQCIGASYAMRGLPIPFLGVYGACSTMAESLALAALLLDGGFCRCCGAMTSSHFCSAERQYRMPLAYGGQRTPTAQWTATAAGALLLSAHGLGPCVTHVTIGKVIDMGIRDANNMGAAMAPAAFDTLRVHFQDLQAAPGDYDLIVTGDLGLLGKEIVIDLFAREGTDLSANFQDCGLLLFDRSAQDVHCGASGCGCSAAVLAGHLLQELRAGRLGRLLFCGTGALLSPTSVLQGESIPAVCHAVAIAAPDRAM